MKGVIQFKLINLLNLIQAKNVIFIYVIAVIAVKVNCFIFCSLDNAFSLILYKGKIYSTVIKLVFFFQSFNYCIKCLQNIIQRNSLVTFHNFIFILLFTLIIGYSFSIHDYMANFVLSEFMYDCAFLSHSIIPVMLFSLMMFFVTP